MVREHTFHDYGSLNSVKVVPQARPRTAAVATLGTERAEGSALGGWQGPRDRGLPGAPPAGRREGMLTVSTVRVCPFLLQFLRRTDAQHLLCRWGELTLDLARDAVCASSSCRRLDANGAAPSCSTARPAPSSTMKRGFSRWWEGVSCRQCGWGRPFLSVLIAPSVRLSRPFAGNGRTGLFPSTSSVTCSHRADPFRPISPSSLGFPEQL